MKRAISGMREISACIAANAVFMDFRDAKQVLWDVVKGVDDDDSAFLQFHGSIEPSSEEQGQ